MNPTRQEIPALHDALFPPRVCSAMQNMVHLATMIYRYIHRGFLRPGADIASGISVLTGHWAQALENETLLAASLFRWHHNLFMYYESADTGLLPEKVALPLAEVLLDYPVEKGRLWAQMVDVFHYTHPRDQEHWLRQNKSVAATARVNRLKPSMYASYVSHHYQLQEECPGLGDKYGIIGAHENLLFFYQEEPKTVESVQQPGTLSTRNSPREDWQQIMTDHFQPWDDDGDAWRPIETLLQAFPGTGAIETGLKQEA